MHRDIRAAFLRHGEVPSEQVQVQLGDALTTITVRGMSAGARGRLLNVVMIESEDGDTRKIDLGKLYPMLVLECSFDPQSGERIFSEGDFDLVSELNADVLDPIATVASRLSGLGDKTLQEAEKRVSPPPGPALPVLPDPGAGSGDDGGGSRGTDLRAGADGVEGILHTGTEAVEA